MLLLILLYKDVMTKLSNRKFSPLFCTIFTMQSHTPLYFLYCIVPFAILDVGMPCACSFVRTN